MSLSIHTIYRQIFKVWRRRRFVLFLFLMKPNPSDILLDIGGYPGFWTSHPQPVKRIDTLNVHEVQWNGEQAPNHNIKILVGDGCCLTMSDQSYDIAFSNSVIEHVGSWERQQQFAGEIRRVAKHLWVQTPAYECPIEPHYLAPFVPLSTVLIPEADFAVVHAVGVDRTSKPRPDQLNGRDHPTAAEIGNASAISRLRTHHRTVVLDHPKILHRHPTGGLRSWATAPS